MIGGNLVALLATYKVAAKVLQCGGTARVSHLWRFAHGTGFRAWVIPKTVKVFMKYVQYSLSLSILSNYSRNSIFYEEKNQCAGKKYVKSRFDCTICP